MKRIVLHIERLVLRGLGKHDGARISRDLQNELGRLLANSTSVHRLASLGTVPRIDAGKVSRATGAEAARAVTKSLLR